MSIKSAGSYSNHAVAKSTSIISFAILCSRVLGFIRDIVIARLFGVYVYAQAFVIAFKIPNLLRDFVGEGAANAAIVPVFSEYQLKHSKEEFWHLVNVVLNLLLVILAALTILGIIFAPLIVRLIAPGFTADSYKLATTIKLTRIIFPYVLLICLAAYAMGVLNSLKHFSVPAFAPCLLNISIIVFALLFGEGITGLSLGVLVGGLLQLLVQIPVLYKRGFRLGLFRNFSHPQAKKIGSLMLPRLFSSCIYQLNNFVDSIFGSLSFIVGDGGVVGLYFAYRLILFPLGIFSTALSQAILPTFSLQVLEENHDNLKKSFSFGLRATNFVVLPASAAFMALSFPIVSTIFEGGKFDLYSVRMTAQILFFFSLGLFAYGSSRVLQSCFFALKDTRTPAKVAFLALIMNIIFNFLFIFPMKLSGIALATSLSGIISFCILFFILKRKLAPLNVKPIMDSFWRSSLASIAMGLICFFVAKGNIFGKQTLLLRYLNLGLAIFVGLLSYLVFCFLFKVKELRSLARYLLAKIH